MKKAILAALGVALVGLSAPAFAADASAFTGSWKSLREISGWSDGKFPKDFSLTINLKFDGDKLAYHSENDTNKQAPPRVLAFNAAFNGKTYPIAGSDRYNQVRITRIGDDAFELLQLKDGDVIVGGYWRLLPDGRLVRWGVAKNPDGSSHSYLEYFRK